MKNEARRWVMARTYTPEGKLSLETKIGLWVSVAVLAACGYLGLRELTGSPEDPDSPSDGNQPKSTEVLAAIDATRAAAEANGSIYTARESEGMVPAISPELAQVAGLSLIDPQTAPPAELQAYSEQIRNRLEKVGIRGDFQIMVVDLDLGAGARGAVPLVFNSTTGESFAVFGSDETGDTVPFNMGVGYYVWEMGRGTAADGTKVVGLMLPAVAEGKQALAPIITVKDGEVFLQWPFNAVPKAPAEFDLIGIGPGGKKVLADLAGLPTEEFSTAIPESTLTATSTATLKPTLTRTPRLTSTPRPTREFTLTPTQELLFPNELSGCGSISNVDEILASEREKFSFERDLPLIQQNLKIEKPNTKDLYVLRLGTVQLRPEDSPIKPVTCSRMIVDGADVYVAGIAVRNKDGSTGFLHVMIGGTDADGAKIPVFVNFIDATGGWRPRQTEADEVFWVIKGGFNVILVGYGTKDRAGVFGIGLKFYIDYFDNHPELFKLMEEYFRTGIVPEELQKVPIPLYGVNMLQ